MGKRLTATTVAQHEVGGDGDSISIGKTLAATPRASRAFLDAFPAVPADRVADMARHAAID